MSAEVLALLYCCILFAIMSSARAPIVKLKTPLRMIICVAISVGCRPKSLNVLKVL